MRTFPLTVIAPAVLLLLGGCASIVDGSTQVVSVKSAAQDGSEVEGANCKLTNSKGDFFVSTPGTVSVHRDGADLSVNCKKAGMTAGIAIVKSHAKGLAFGNILAGGIIGGAVDMSTGAAYDYPTLITVEMGKTITVDEKPNPTQQKPTGTPDTQEQKTSKN